MSENNLIMTIVLVVAATLLFTGGLTGNVPRSNFAYNPSYVNAGGAVICSEVNEGRILAGNIPAIVHVNSDCSETTTEYCPSSSRPFITVRTGYGQEEVQCRGLAISSANDAFPGIQ